MLIRFAIQQFSTPATCIARNACTGVLYCAHGKSDDHVFRISAECLTLVRSLLPTCTRTVAYYRAPRPFFGQKDPTDFLLYSTVLQNLHVRFLSF